MHRKVAGAVAVALALGVASCGGGDEPLTKAELVKQVNVICKGKPQKTSTTGKRGPEAFFEQILDRQKEVAEGLDALKPPAELEDELAALKKAGDGRIALIEKAVAAVKENPKKPDIESLSEQGEAVQRQMTRAATALGVKNCA